MTVIEKLDINVKQANSDFVAIKNKIIEKGVEIAEGTRTSEYASKIDELYEIAESSQWWDYFQNYGQRTFYPMAFIHSGFEYIRPKYVIRPSDDVSAARAMFAYSTLKKAEAKHFDLSNVASSNDFDNGYFALFMGCQELEEVEDIGLSAPVHYDSAFSGCTKLKTIAKITARPGKVFYNAFDMCYSLENITFEGTISMPLYLGYSEKLSKASITSIINALSDDASGLSVTLSRRAKEAAFPDSQDGVPNKSWIALINTKPNWTINIG